MIKCSAHYALNENGVWIKRPIIEVNELGYIVSIRESGDEFKEEPGLQYFSGVIVPAFVRVFPKEIDDAGIKRNIVAGVRRFVFREHPKQSIPSNVTFKVKDIQGDVGTVDVWENVHANIKAGLSLGGAILKESKDMAICVGECPNWGCIKVGSNPGLLLLKGVDLKTFTLTDQFSIRVLVE